MLGFHGMSEQPMSALVSTTPLPPTDRLILVNTFRVVKDRFGKDVALGNGILSVSFSFRPEATVSAAGASHMGVRLNSTAGSTATLSGASFASAGCNAAAVASVSAAGVGLMSGSFSVSAAATLTVEGSSI